MFMVQDTQGGDRVWPRVFKTGHERAGQRCNSDDVKADFDAVKNTPEWATPGHLPEWAARF